MLERPAWGFISCMDPGFIVSTAFVVALSRFERMGGWGKESEEHLLFASTFPPSPYLQSPSQTCRASPTEVKLVVSASA